MAKGDFLQKWLASQSGKQIAIWNMADRTMERLDKLMAAYDDYIIRSLIDPGRLTHLYAVTRAWFSELHPVVLHYLASMGEKAGEWKRRLGIENVWQFRQLFDFIADLIDGEKYEQAYNLLEEIGYFLRSVMQEYKMLYMIDFVPPNPGLEVQLAQLYGDAFMKAWNERREK